jgi:acyl-CoA thioester hydrolase
MSMPIEISVGMPETSVWPEEYRICVCLADTDAGGVVHHANYLRYFEQARGECLRTRGVGQRALYVDNGLALAVRRANVDYVKPAMLDDLLVITSRVLQMQKATIDFLQEIRRRDVLIATAEIRLACIDVQSLKASAFPNELITLLRP